MSAAVPSGNLASVKLDLNLPQFQAQLFDLDVSEIKKVLKTFKKLNAMTWNDVLKDHGLNFEAIKSVADKYSIRISQSYRAVVMRDDVWMRFQSLHLDHDGAYGKK